MIIPQILTPCFTTRLGLFALLLQVSVCSGFQIIDTFDSDPPGPLALTPLGNWQTAPSLSKPVVVLDPATGQKHVAFGNSTSGGAFVSMSRVLPAAMRISASGFSTFYCRIRPHGARIDHSIGLADGLSAEPTYNDFHPQVAFLNVSAATFKISARSGASTFDILPTAQKGLWHDIWIVTDRARGMYDVWHAVDGAHPVLLANDYSFRTPTSNELSTVLVLCNGQNSDNLSVDLDDFHVRPGRIDLSRPRHPGIQPAALRVTTFNTRSGTGTSLTTFRDNYLNSDHVICLQEVQRSDWNVIQALFPNHPHRLLTVKNATRLFSFKTECVAILSSLPILESDSKIIQIDPQGDRWERWAQYVRIDLGGSRSARIFHYHNTYNFDENAFQSEKAGMVKFRDWILQKTGVTSLAAVPDLIAVGDFNLTSSVDVLAIMSMPLVHANDRDYIMANPVAKARTTLWTNPALSDHNGLAASFGLSLLHDRYEKWVLDAFTDAELRSGLGLPGQDADGDGKSNFTEYAENHQPWRPLPAPVASGLKEGRPFAAFRRGANRTDVRFTLHHSPDLIHWFPAAIAEGAGPANTVGNHAISETLLENNETLKLEIFAEKDSLKGFYKLQTERISP